MVTLYWACGLFFSLWVLQVSFFLLKTLRTMSSKMQTGVWGPWSNFSSFCEAWLMKRTIFLIDETDNLPDYQDLNVCSQVPVWEHILHPVIHALNSHKSQDWTRSKAWVRNSSQVCPVGDRASCAWTTFCWLLRPLSRQLEWKQSCWDSNWHVQHGMPMLQASPCLPCHLFRGGFLTWYSAVVLLPLLFILFS